MILGREKSVSDIEPLLGLGDCLFPDQSIREHHQRNRQSHIGFLAFFPGQR